MFSGLEPSMEGNNTYCSWTLRSSHSESVTRGPREGGGRAASRSPSPPGVPRPPLEDPRAAALPRPLLPLPCPSPAWRMTRLPPRSLRHGVGCPRARLVLAPAKARFSDGRLPGSGSARPSLPACLGWISRATRDSHKRLCVSSPSQIETTVRWE